jgi:HSP20 family protein
MNAPVPVKQAQTAPAQRAAFNMFGSLQREIDRLFEDFAPGFTPAFASRSFADVKCRMDLAETRDGFELTVELPGLEEKDVDVFFADGVLTISGEKRFDSEEKDKTYRFVERGYGSFSRSIQLFDGVKAEDIKASMAKGVLKVAIPAPAKVQAKKIAVKPAA